MPRRGSVGLPICLLLGSFASQVAEAAPDFSLSASPTTQTVVQGGGVAYTITVTPIEGFTGVVSFTASGLPGGATAGFNPTTVTGSGSTTMTVSTAMSTPAGSSTLTVTGTSGSLSHTATVTLIVNSAISYTYDAVGRLTAVVDPTGQIARYNYDAVGNLLSIDRLSSVSVLSFSPASGAIGATVTITGTGFSSTPSQNTVQFNGVTATVTSSTTTQIVATVPSGATTGPISVTSPSGSATSTSIFTVTPTLGAPTITSFTPTIGASGTPVTISGTNFDTQPSNNTVKFNGTTAAVYSATSTTINTGVPSVAGSGRITVQTAAGQAVSAGDFFVVPSPYAASSVGATGRMTVGASMTINLNLPNQVAVLVFEGTQGQKIRLLVTSSMSSSAITIYNPDGSVLASAPSVGLNGSFIDTAILAATGTYTVLVVPQSGLMGSMTLLPTVPPSTADFNLVALPNFPQTNTSSPTYSVYVNSGTGFSGSVSLSASGLPTGATASFSPTAPAAPGVSLMTVTVGASTPAGSYTLTVTGVGSGLTRTTTATLNVNPVPSPWANQDIPGGGIAGRAQYSGGTFTVQGSGGWNWTYESFHFVHQPLTGDGTIIARVASVQNSQTNAKAGVMIREALTWDSKNAMVVIEPNQNLASFLYRTTTGGSRTSAGALTASVPYWVKLVREGSVFTAYASSDGTAWTQIGSSITITMASSVYVGLAVSSLNGSALTAANFDNVTLTTTADYYLTASPFTAIRVNCGGGAYTDPANQVWSADYGYSGGSGWGTGSSISGTVTPTLYQTLRYSASTFQYQFSVPNGSYAVRLKFAEIFFTQAGQRVFNVNINGQAVLSNFDVFVEAGGAFKAVDRQFTVAVSTSQIVIQLVPVVSNPAINAIEILPAPGTAIYTVNVKPLSGFTGSVGLSVSNLPTGTTATFDPTAVSPPGTSTLSVTTSPSTPAGTYTLGITGASGGLSHTITAPLKVEGADFSVTASPSSRTINVGLSTTYTVTVAPMRDFAGTVNLSVSGIPAGATASFNPASVNGSGYSTLTVTTGTSTPGRTYTLTITGTSGGLTHSTPVTLVVSAPDFTVSATPSAQVVSAAGGSTTYTVTVTALNGFNKTVNLGIGGLPVGATASFSPPSITGSGSSTLTATAAAGTLTGKSVLTVTGTSADTLGGNLARSTTVSLWVNSVPSPWLNQDVGSVGIVGSASNSGGSFTVQGSGTSISGTADSFHYAYQALTGDGTILARVAGVQNGFTNSQAGVMIRESLAANSTYAMVDLQPNQSTAVFRRRTSTGGSSTATTLSAITPPYWVKVVRQGNTFSGYASSDGVTWTQIGTSTTISMAVTVYVGLAVSANNNGALTTAAFDNVSVAGVAADFYLAPSPQVRAVPTAGSSTYTVNVNALNGFGGTVDLSVSGLPAGATAMFIPMAVTGSGSSTLTVTAGAGTPAGTSGLTITGTSGSLSRSANAVFSVLPGATWANQDIGSVGIAGSTTYSDGVFTVRASGADIWSTADSFHFAYQQLTGDGTVIARVTNMQNLFTSTKAGVMIRETLAAGSANAMVELQPNAYQAPRVFQWRSTTGGSTSSTNGPTNTRPPYWVKLVRQGNSFTAYAGSDGITWTQIGSPVTISMAASVYAGLAVSAANNAALSTSFLDNITVAPSTPDFYVSPPLEVRAVGQGGTVTYLLNVNALYGFAGSVSLSVSGLPTGATASFNPTTVTGSGSSTLSVAAGASTPPGTYPLTITGTSGALTRSTVIPLRVSNLPSPWVDQDIGAVGISGTASYSGGAFTVQASGTAIFNYADEFHFVYQSLTGDGTIIARLTGRQNVFASSKAGLMIRETLTPGSKNVFWAVYQPSPTLTLQNRAGTAGGTVGTLGISLTLPRWLKLERQGNTFNAYVSQDGITWVQNAGQAIVSMANTVYFGVVVSAENNNALMNATVDSVTVTSP